MTFETPQIWAGIAPLSERSKETARSFIEGFYLRFPKVKDFFDQKWEKLKKLPDQERIVRNPRAKSGRSELPGNSRLIRT